MSTLTGHALNEADERYAVRAAAHAAEPSVLRAAQRFAPYVSDLAVARVMLALERGTEIHRNSIGRWFAPIGHPLGRQVSTVIQEMIRTGLVRDYRQPNGEHVLIPAKTHLRVREELTAQHSLCLFAGEDLGPMRARLVDQMDLVDCLECEALASGTAVRRL
jgi:hypothetical protein